MAQKLQLFYYQLQIELEVICTISLNFIWQEKNIAKKSDGFHNTNGNFTKKRPNFANWPNRTSGAS